MAVINTGLLTAGLRNEFFARFGESPQHYKDLATRVSSKTKTEDYKFLGTVPKMREWGTGRLTQGLRSESYSIENLKYEATIEVDRDEISDDQTGQIRIRVGELAARAATHKDFLIGELLKAGADADALAYDGLPFFSAAHVSGDSGTQSNLLTFDASVTTNPTVQEFKDSLKAAVSKMMAYKDDQGDPMMLVADGLIVLVPPSMYFTAQEAISAAIIGNTGNVVQGLARVISFPWLTDQAVWYLCGTASPTVRAFVFQDREPIEFNALENDSDEAFKREKFLFGVRARYRLAYGYWQYAVKTTFV